MHLLTGGKPAENEALLARLRGLPSASLGKVVEVGDNEGTALRGDGRAAVPTPGRVACRSGTHSFAGSSFDARGNVESAGRGRARRIHAHVPNRATGGHATGGSSPAASRGASAGGTAPSTGRIVRARGVYPHVPVGATGGSTGAGNIPPPPAPEAAPAPPPPAPAAASEPGEFTRMFRSTPPVPAPEPEIVPPPPPAPQAAAPPPPPAPAAHPSPASLRVCSGQRRQRSRRTRRKSPASARTASSGATAAPPPAETSEPGEFTRMFQPASPAARNTGASSPASSRAPQAAPPPPPAPAATSSPASSPACSRRRRRRQAGLPKRRAPHRPPSRVNPRGSCKAAPQAAAPIGRVARQRSRRIYALVQGVACRRRPGASNCRPPAAPAAGQRTGRVHAHVPLPRCPPATAKRLASAGSQASRTGRVHAHVSIACGGAEGRGASAGSERILPLLRAFRARAGAAVSTGGRIPGGRIPASAAPAARAAPSNQPGGFTQMFGIPGSSAPPPQAHKRAAPGNRSDAGILDSAGAARSARIAGAQRIHAHDAGASPRGGGTAGAGCSGSTWSAGRRGYGPVRCADDSAAGAAHAGHAAAGAPHAIHAAAGAAHAVPAANGALYTAAGATCRGHRAEGS